MTPIISPTDTQELRRRVAQELHLPERLDPYFYLLRVGANFDNYSFWWEPFRDLAGPLNPGANAVPVLVVSTDSATDPERVQFDNPVPHIRLSISRRCTAASVATAWLELLSDDDVCFPRDYKSDYSWFLSGLKLNVADISQKAAAFLQRGLI